MKKLIVKGSIFVVLVVILCGVFLLMSAKEPMRTYIAQWTDSADYMDENQMLPAYEQAAQEDGKTILLIGDSICQQLFTGLEEENPRVAILPTNASLMVPGQYLLAERFLEHHPDTTDVFLMLHPLPMIRTFDVEWGYRNAAMTYVETNTLEKLDENTIRIMKSVYGGLFLQPWVVELVEQSPLCRKLSLSYLNANRKPYIQSSSFEISQQYVVKLYELCQEYGANLHLYTAPVSEHYREQMEELEEEYKDTRLDELYPNYFQQIKYYSNEWTEDYSHFSPAYATRENFNQIIRWAYEDSYLLEILSLDKE